MENSFNSSSTGENHISMTQTLNNAIKSIVEKFNITSTIACNMLEHFISDPVMKDLINHIKLKENHILEDDCADIAASLLSLQTKCTRNKAKELNSSLKSDSSFDPHLDNGGAFHQEVTDAPLSTPLPSNTERKRKSPSPSDSPPAKYFLYEDGQLFACPDPARKGEALSLNTSNTESSFFNEFVNETPLSETGGPGDYFAKNDMSEDDDILNDPNYDFLKELKALQFDPEEFINDNSVETNQEEVNDLLQDIFSMTVGEDFQIIDGTSDPAIPKTSPPPVQDASSSCSSDDSSETRSSDDNCPQEDSDGLEPGEVILPKWLNTQITKAAFFRPGVEMGAKGSNKRVKSRRKSSNLKRKVRYKKSGTTTAALEKIALAPNTEQFFDKNFRNNSNQPHVATNEYQFSPNSLECAETLHNLANLSYECAGDAAEQVNEGGAHNINTFFVIPSGNDVHNGEFISQPPAPKQSPVFPYVQLLQNKEPSLPAILCTVDATSPVQRAPRYRKILSKSCIATPNTNAAAKVKPAPNSALIFVPVSKVDGASVSTNHVQAPIPHQDQSKLGSTPQNSINLSLRSEKMAPRSSISSIDRSPASLSSQISRNTIHCRRKNESREESENKDESTSHSAMESGGNDSEWNKSMDILLVKRLCDHDLLSEDSEEISVLILRELSQKLGRKEEDVKRRIKYFKFLLKKTGWE